MTITPYQRVALTVDMPEHHLRKGDVAVVVEHVPASAAAHEEEGYALEVCNALGDTIAVVIVPAPSVEALREDEVLHVRLMR